MNENKTNIKNLYSKTRDYIKQNFKIIIIFLSFCFIIFLSFQIFNYYKLNKIQNNSISFLTVIN